MSRRFLVCSFLVAIAFISWQEPYAWGASNLLTNGDFEQGQTGWSKDIWDNGVFTLSFSSMAIDSIQHHSGSNSFKITSNALNDVRWMQTVNVTPNRNYRLSGWIKTSNVVGQAKPQSAGGNLCLMGGWTVTSGLQGTNEWTYRSVDFNSGSNATLTIGARLGFYSDTATGTAWFDDISLTEITYHLTVNKTGSGNGTVLITPPGGSAGTCTSFPCVPTHTIYCVMAPCPQPPYEYYYGETATLTATPASGSTFTGWSGGGCSGTGDCTVTMKADTTVTANFNALACTGANVTAWSTCQPNGTQTAGSYTATPQGCTGTPPSSALTKSCTYVPPPTCTASDVNTWGTCQPNGIQTAASYAPTCTPPSSFLTKKCASVQLPQTGQTTTYAAGDDGSKQTGAAWPNPRFTVGTGTQAMCVTDNLTGLMWVKIPDSTTMTWWAAIDYAKGLNLCGFTDWRVPSIIELESLVNLETSKPWEWLNTQGFSNVQDIFYWSSTSYASYLNSSFMTDSAYVFTTFNGAIGHAGKSINYPVWPVRGGQSAVPANIWNSGQRTCYSSSFQNPMATVKICLLTGQDGELRPGISWPFPRFSNNQDGTVTDHLTGLIWLKDANCFGSKTWQQALSAANNLSSDQCSLSDSSRAGDWHLPNRKELLSLVDFEYFNPALSNTAGTAQWSQGDPFDNVQSDSSMYWSSTTRADTSNAWWVAMGDGSSGNFSKTDNSSNSFYVWPVRGGQSGNDCVVILGSDLFIHIPVISYGNAYYWLDMQYIPNTLNFSVTGLGPVTDMTKFTNCASSVLNNDWSLHIPNLVIPGASYWADFKYGGGVIFTVTGLGEN